jgi:hypothetical protein
MPASAIAAAKTIMIGMAGSRKRV